MTRLDKYRSALLAAFPDVGDGDLANVLGAHGPQFASFIVDHGLGPLWHDRTGLDEFRESRMSAEALYLAQEHALVDIDTALGSAGIEYALIKGAATRLLLYENPALRSCYDLDVLVHPANMFRAASALLDAGFTAHPDPKSISRELVLSRDAVDVDLHWGLLREGRLRNDPVSEMLGRRRREHGTWMLAAEDAMFLLLVHPAFAKHLEAYEMGLHRVVDIVQWLQTQSFDRNPVLEMLAQNGVRTAAWAALRWVQLLTQPHTTPGIDTFISDVSPGRMRRTWLDHWLTNDWSSRTANIRWARLPGFTAFLHDTPRDALRALAGRGRAHRRSSTDMAAFDALLGQ